jgi:hypothetical protein
MTTHERHTDPTPVEGTGQPSAQPSAQPTEQPMERHEQTTERVQPSSERPAPSASTERPTPATTPEPTTAQSESESTAVTTSGTDEASTTSSDRELFADNELAGLRVRWDYVQAGFVDDPRECVQKADGLVSDVVEQLTTSFSQARSRLEDQWARGEEASTEDLRIALKRYREFFERLLSV